MSRFHFLHACILCLITTLRIDHAQTPAAPVQTLATSQSQTPDEFMRTVAKAATDLTAPEMKPWHLRARYKQFRPDGTVNREGVFEEWWASPSESKTVNSGSDFSHTEYKTTGVTLYTGTVAFAPAPGLELLLHPLPYDALLEKLTFTAQQIVAGTTKLECYSGKMKAPSDTFRSTVYCFSQPPPVLRVTEDMFGKHTAWNAIVSLHDRYIAKEVSQTDAQHNPSLSLNIELVEPTLGIDEAALAPPADAKPLPPRKVAISSGVMQKNRISGDAPAYPSDAKLAHVQGTVVIQGTVGTDGKILQLRIVSGPPMLQEAAINAVKTWRYSPYRLNGEPVEVETTMNVVFNVSP